MMGEGSKDENHAECGGGDICSLAGSGAAACTREQIRPSGRPRRTTRWAMRVDEGGMADGEGDGSNDTQGYSE